MFPDGWQHPTLRSLRFLDPALLVAALALGACGGADAPLAPSGDEQAASPARPEEVVTALTTSQRIVFTSTRNGGYDIYKMDPQGYNVVRLTTSSDWEFTPGWSRDNSRIAFVRSRRDASNISHYDIYVIKADGSNGHWARSSTAKYDLLTPIWSPDGSRLVVNVYISGVYYLGWIDLASGQLGLFNAMAGGIKGRYPAYDPTGTKIIYSGPLGTTIDQINADGSGHKVLISSTTGVAEPAFSPDGKKIAFDKLAGTNMDIYVKNFADGSTKRLTTDSHFDTHPIWSPDGTRIAFTTDRSGVFQIYTTDAATGGSLTRITHTATVERDPMWTH